MQNLIIQYLGSKNVGQVIEVSALDLAKLQSLLMALLVEEPLLINIVLPDGNELTVGLGPTRSCVQFSGKEHEPPYLIAQEPTADFISDEEVEFDAGGTPTPIHISDTLSTSKAIMLIMDIVRSGQLPEYVAWKEV